MPRVQVETHVGPAKRRIVSGLIAFNAGAVGSSPYKGLAVTLRDGKAIVGGVTGWTWKEWCHVDLLWIDHKHRGKGRGTALMRRAESVARRRGAKNMFLDTFSFQAPGFYKKLGFREFGRLKNFPAGHTRYFLHKAL